ncbi:glycosyltransferase family 2 protein [Belliella marina]|uniref:Glycosyltransferase family 2 protein n=1 Tax=Belliella marina TaxID=1644146 RepID=A0ABW4VKY0_9BACT
MDSPSVAIIIINWNTYTHSRNCLQQLLDLKYGNYEVILVDNGSKDKSGMRLQSEFPDCTYLANTENLGFTGGNNTALKYATDKGFDYVLLLNNDTHFDSDFLLPLVAALENSPKLGAVQPIIYDFHNRKSVWHAGGVFNQRTGQCKSQKYETELTSPYFTDWLTGCAFMIRSSVLNEVGPLNQTFFAYFEDVDWSLRIRKIGYQLQIVPQSVIYHEISASTKAQAKQKEGFISPMAHYLNIRNQFLLLKSHPNQINKLLAWPYQCGKTLTFILYFLVRCRFKKLKASIHGMRDGLLDDPNDGKLPQAICYL